MTILSWFFCRLRVHTYDCLELRLGCQSLSSYGLKRIKKKRKQTKEHRLVDRSRSDAAHRRRMATQREFITRSSSRWMRRRAKTGNPLKPTGRHCSARQTIRLATQIPQPPSNRSILLFVSQINNTKRQTCAQGPTPTHKLGNHTRNNRQISGPTRWLVRCGGDQSMQRRWAGGRAAKGDGRGVATPISAAGRNDDRWRRPQ